MIRAFGIILIVLAQLAADVKPLRPRALWVWDFAPILRDANERSEFIDLCRRHSISAIAIQFATVRSGATRRLADSAQWKAVIAASHRAGITVHALDGSPQYALTSQHATALSIVDAVIAYNAAAGTAERFDGVHLDIEPYQLPEWTSAREPLLTQYLEIHERAAQRSRAAGLLYGADVPFWWVPAEGADDDHVSLVTYRGVRQSAAAHLLEFVDNLAVMAYRRVAAGPDGIIAHALPTLRLADRIGRGRVAVGVETESPSDSVPDKTTFAEASLSEMEAQLGEVERAFAGHASFLGIAVHRYTSFRRMDGVRR